VILSSGGKGWKAYTLARRRRRRIKKKYGW
jgi:hypothetical protein